MIHLSVKYVFTVPTRCVLFGKYTAVWDTDCLFLFVFPQRLWPSDQEHLYFTNIWNHQLTQCLKCSQWIWNQWTHLLSTGQGIGKYKFFVFSHNMTETCKWYRQRALQWFKEGIEQITCKDLLYSTGSYTQYFGITY